MPGIRVLLADDHTLFRDGLASLLSAWDMEVVGQASNGLEAVALARQLTPDLVLMDVNMPRMNGLEATRIIKAELPEIKVVILTVSDDEENLFEAVKSGAHGYILKNIPGDEFGALLASLAQGEPAMSRGLAKRVLEEFARAAASNQHTGRETQMAEPLTARERAMSWSRWRKATPTGRLHQRSLSLRRLSNTTSRTSCRSFTYAIGLR